MKANYTYLSDGTKAAALNAAGTGYDYAGSFTYSHAANRWRFGGKEEQDGAFGIAYTDFGARFYDRTAWTSIDPMAEKYYAVSPYAYCNNNPVRLYDSDGQIVHIAVGALIGGAISGGVAALQGRSMQEVKAAVAGGAVAGAITAAAGGMNVAVAIGGSVIAGAAGSAVEQSLGTGTIDKETLVKDALAGGLGGAAASRINSVIKMMSKKARAIGPGSKQQIRASVSKRIQSLSGAEKAMVEIGEDLLENNQEALTGEGSKYMVHYIYEEINPNE